MTRLLALALLSTAGCAPFLHYRAQPPSLPLAGRVVIEVHDRREPGRGGLQPQQIGVHANLIGIPRMLLAETPTTVDDTMARLVADAARAAGIGVAPPGQEATATARVVVEVQRFWCTGYTPVYKGDVTASLSVVDAAGNVRVPAVVVHGEDGGLGCKKIYETALTRFFDGSRALFATPEVRAAATTAR